MGLMPGQVVGKSGTAPLSQLQSRRPGLWKAVWACLSAECRPVASQVGQLPAQGPRWPLRGAAQSLLQAALGRAVRTPWPHAYNPARCRCPAGPSCLSPALAGAHSVRHFSVSETRAPGTSSLSRKAWAGCGPLGQLGAALALGGSSGLVPSAALRAPSNPSCRTQGCLSRAREGVPASSLEPEHRQKLCTQDFSISSPAPAPI